jgi:hypothetical protein
LICTIRIAAVVPTVHGARVRTPISRHSVAVVTMLKPNFLAVSTDCNTASLSTFRGGGAVPSRLLGTGAVAAIPADGVVIIADLVTSKDPISAYGVAELWC